MRAPAVKSLPQLAITKKREIFDETWNQLGQAAMAAQPEEPEVAKAPATKKKKSTPPTTEIFLHRDNDITVWKQLGREWKFSGAVIWTLGAGTGVRAFFEERKTVLALALNETHKEEVETIVDNGSMEHMTNASSKNWIFDKDIMKEYQKASDLKKKTKNKKAGKKNAGKSKNGKKSANAKTNKDKKTKKDKKRKNDKKSKKKHKSKKDKKDEKEASQEDDFLEAETEEHEEAEEDEEEQEEEQEENAEEEEEEDEEEDGEEEELL